MGLWLLSLLFGLLALVLWISGTLHQLLPGVLLLCGCGRICMSGPLLDVVRAVIAIVLSDRLPIPLRAPLLVLRFLTRLQPLQLCLSWNGYSWEIPPFPAATCNQVLHQQLSRGRGHSSCAAWLLCGLVHQTWKQGGDNTSHLPQGHGLRHSLT